MKKENRTHILLRYILVIGFILLFAGWIICHSFDNTVMSANKWNDKAMSELSRVVEISPERGNILSNNGQILATNLSFYHVRIDYRSERFLPAVGAGNRTVSSRRDLLRGKALPA